MPGFFTFVCDCPNDFLLLVSDHRAIITIDFCITVADGIVRFTAFTGYNAAVMTTIDMLDAEVDFDVVNLGLVVLKGLGRVKLLQV